MLIKSLIRLPRQQIAKQLVDETHEVFIDTAIRLGINVAPPVRDPPLPEYLFVGSTHSGKSTLLRGLLKPKTEDMIVDVRCVPRISRRMGYTKVCTPYAIGDLMSLVDTPGYGLRAQADAVPQLEQYIHEAQPRIRDAFLLVHSKRGVTAEDRRAFDILRASDLRTSFILTECDRLYFAFQRDYTLDALVNRMERAFEAPVRDRLSLTSGNSLYGVPELRAFLYANRLRERGMPDVVTGDPRLGEPDQPAELAPPAKSLDARGQDWASFTSKQEATAKLNLRRATMNKSKKRNRDGPISSRTAPAAASRDE